LTRARWRRAGAKSRAKLAVKLAPIKCAYCGKEFLPANRTIKYDTNECRYKGRQKYFRDRLRKIAIAGGGIGSDMLPEFKRDEIRTKERRGTSRTYFIRMRLSRGLGPVKIGQSKNVDGRILDYDTYMPYGCVLIGSVPGSSLESAAHALLAKFRLRGEWFEWTPEVEEWVKAAIQSAATDPT
jgi:hypothetical protein